MCNLHSFKKPYDIYAKINWVRRFNRVSRFCCCGSKKNMRWNRTPRNMWCRTIHCHVRQSHGISSEKRRNKNVLHAIKLHQVSMKLLVSGHQKRKNDGARLKLANAKLEEKIYREVGGELRHVKGKYDVAKNIVRKLRPCKMEAHICAYIHILYVQGFLLCFHMIPGFGLPCMHFYFSKSVMCFLATRNVF